MGTEPLSELEKYKDHRRLRVFYNKGVECVTPGCDKVGAILVQGMDRAGNIHIDLCTKDFYPLTVDHIIPKSKGGPDDLENLQPMCTKCNTKKGNGDKNPVKKKDIARGNRGYDIKIGDTVYKKRSHIKLGTVKAIKPNHHHPRKVLAVVIEERDPESLYTLQALYKKKG